MDIKSVGSKSFSAYGKTVDGFDFSNIIDELIKTTECPAGKVIYVPGDKHLESLPVAAQIRDNLYGGMPVQIGYCNGDSVVLNCLEYHKGSETIIPAEDIILLLAHMDKLEGNTLDTAHVEAFAVPKGTAVVLYETTLHYAPCNGAGKNGFRAVIVLLKGTNTDTLDIEKKSEEDKLLWMRNKWLIAHPDSPEAAQGAFVGLTGVNIKI